MEKWLRKDWEASEKLFKQLEESDNEKPKIKEQQDKLKPAMRASFRKYNLGLSEGDGDLMTEGRIEGGKLLSEKYNIQDRWYRRRTEIENQLRGINQHYIIATISDLNKLVRQILNQRKFEVTDKKKIGDRGLPFYFVSHNWVSIGKVVEGLMTSMDAILDSGLAKVSAIRATYEEAIKSIPDDFPLTDRSEGTEGMLTRFREGTGEGHIEIVPDDFISMTLAQGKNLADVSRFKGALNGLKKFFKSEENSFRSTQNQRGSRWPIL